MLRVGRCLGRVGMRHPVVSLRHVSDEQRLREKDTSHPTIVDRAPEWMQDYLRLSRADRPIGTWLLFWPCTWSLIAAAGSGIGTPASLAANMALFGTGAVVMRSAGCVVNDMWDADLDRHVERTAGRPLASGAISLPQAAAYLGAHGVVGLSILAQYPLPVVGLGAASLALVGIYPAMKRVTYWPQAVLGLTFNWGVWLGYAAQAGSLASLPLETLAPLYASGVAWTLWYDTIYAFQDMEDDRKVGIKSSALAIAHNPSPYLGAFGACATAGLAVSGVMAGAGPLFYAVGVGGSAAHLAWQYASLKLPPHPESHASALSIFRSNSTYGGLVAAGFALDALARGFT